MANEDFLTYSEEDPGNDVAVESARVTFTNLPLPNTVARVFKSESISGNFTHLFETFMSYSSLGYYGYVRLWGVKAGGGSIFLVEFSGGEASSPNYMLVGDESSSPLSTAFNTVYYHKIEKVGETVTDKIYSDSLRTNLLGTLSVPCSISSFDTVHVLDFDESGGGPEYHSGYIANLDLGEPPAPSPVTTERRVSAIRHVYRPGSYRMELRFGGITDESSVETARLIVKTKKEEAGKEKEITQEVTAPPKVVEEMKAALEDEGIGAIVNRIKTDKAFLRYGYTTTDVMKWAEQGMTPQEILRKMRAYKGAKVELSKTEHALGKIGLTTGQTMDLIKKGYTAKDIVKGTAAEVKQAKAFNKYGYSIEDVQAMVKKGMQPGQIVKYMQEHPQNK